ncbi:hypothetical protein ABPG74_004327 [Tetrahymena malaccensis]
MNDRDNCSLKYTDWRASIKGLSNEQKIAVRLEIIKLKQQGISVSRLIKKFNISKPQLYRILEDPTLKKRGRKTIIKEEKRYDLLKQLIKENGNSFPQRKKFFVKFLKEKQDIQEIPQTTNHVNYPEYDRFRALYDQIKDQFQNQVDTNSLQIYERISKDLNKQNSDNDCDSMCLNLSIYDQSEKRDQFFND